MPPRARRTTSSKPAPWVGRRQLVYVADGPLVGRWYFADGPGSWATLLEAAEHTLGPRLAAGHPPPDVLGYKLTDKLREHPTEEAVGKVLRWAPTRASLPTLKRRQR